LSISGRQITPPEKPKRGRPIGSKNKEKPKPLKPVTDFI
jgi:hypothetical protein